MINRRVIDTCGASAGGESQKKLKIGKQYIYLCLDLAHLNIEHIRKSHVLSRMLQAAGDFTSIFSDRLYVRVSLEISLNCNRRSNQGVSLAVQLFIMTGVTTLSIFEEKLFVL